MTAVYGEGCTGPISGFGITYSSARLRTGGNDNDGMVHSGNFHVDESHKVEKLKISGIEQQERRCSSSLSA